MSESGRLCPAACKGKAVFARQSATSGDGCGGEPPSSPDQFSMQVPVIWRNTDERNHQGQEKFSRLVLFTATYANQQMLASAKRNCRSVNLSSRVVLK